MDFFPSLSVPMQSFFRVAYGVLCLGTFALCAKNWRFFFLSHRYGGYVEGISGWNWWHTPKTLAATGFLWLASLACLTVGYETVLASAINLFFAYHFFIRLRWKSLLRGMGAPGFMWAWLGFAVLALELSLSLGQRARSVVLLTLQVDFAIIMISAGVSKITSGYFRGEGMEYGLVNPMWSYFPGLFSKTGSDRFFYRWMDHGAWALQLVAGVLMLIPATRPYGAAIIALGFIGIAIFIRLGFLCEMVILASFLFFSPGSGWDRKVASLIPDSWWSAPSFSTSVALGAVIEGVFVSYLVLRILSTLALWYNFYARKPLPTPLQITQDFFANTFGVILWRVFTIDQLNFFINIYAEKKGIRELISHYGRVPDVRWSNVAESITVATLFTSLKYFPHQPQIFQDRILRYARSLPPHLGPNVIFEYISIRKEKGQFVFVKTAEFRVDREKATVTEQTLDGSVSIRRTAAVSSAHECAKPGSYLIPSLVRPS